MKKRRFLISWEMKLVGGAESARALLGGKQKISLASEEIGPTAGLAAGEPSRVSGGLVAHG
jgi:hypothetical protein